MVQAMYGVPSEDIQLLYGVPAPEDTLLTVVLRVLTSPIFIIASFVVGVLFYLRTSKKIFLIVPLVICLLSAALALLRYVFGF